MIIVPDDKPVLFLLCGLPESGNREVAQELSEDLEIPIVSYEAVRRGATGGTVPQGMGHKFMDWCCDMIGYYLNLGQSVVYDAQNLSADTRRPFIQTARGLGAHCFAVWTVCDPRTLRQRLLEAQFPAEVFQVAQAAFERPGLEEGFSEIAVWETGNFPVLGGQE